MSTIIEKLVDRLAVSQGSSSVHVKKGPWRRVRKAVLVPAANGAGRAFGFVMRMAGSRLIFWTHSLILTRINPSHLQELSPESTHRRGELYELLDQFKHQAGREASFLILFTHPEPGKKMQLFSVALYHHVFEIGQYLYKLGFSRSYPRLILAIDPFALDSMGWLSGSFYAGFAHTFHFTIDRQPSRLGWLQRILLLRKSASQEAGFRFLNYMKAGSVLALAQAGGEPQNARLLFTTREFVNAVCKTHMKFNRAEFIEHLDGSRLLPAERVEQLRRRALKLSDHDLMLDVFNTILTMDALATGKLDTEHRRQMMEVLEWAGVDVPKISGLVSEFEQEFARYTPYRERLFNILLRRIIKPDLPIVLLPVWHDWHAEKIHLESQEILWQKTSGKIVRYFLDNGNMTQEPVASVSAFAKGFTVRHFPR